MSFLAGHRHRRAIRGVYRPVLADLALFRAIYPDIYAQSGRQALVRTILGDYRPLSKAPRGGRGEREWAEEMLRDAEALREELVAHKWR